MSGLFLEVLKDTFFGSITFEVDGSVLLTVSVELNGGETSNVNSGNFISGRVDLSDNDVGVV